MLPSAGGFDRRPPPYSGSAIEIEEAAGEVAAAVFDDEVTVQNHRFDLRQKRIFAIDVPPARLHHSDFAIAEVIDNVFEKVWRGNEVRIENRDQLACGELQSVLQRAGFESMAIRAMDVMDVETQFAMFLDARRGNLGGAVRRIVQNLNFQQFSRISDAASGFDQPLDNVQFVVDRQLHGDPRLYLQNGLRLCNLVFMLQVQVNEVIAMNSVDGKNDQDGEIRNQNEDVECREVLVETGDSNDRWREAGKNAGAPAEGSMKASELKLFTLLRCLLQMSAVTEC